MATRRQTGSAERTLGPRRCPRVLGVWRGADHLLSLRASHRYAGCVHRAAPRRSARISDLVSFEADMVTIQLDGTQLPS